MKPEAFRWAMRVEVCEQLLEFALRPANGEPAADGSCAAPDPAWAESLLVSLADHSCAELLQQLPGAEGTSDAGRKLALLRLQQKITSTDLVAYIGEHGFWDDIDAAYALVRLLNQQPIETVLPSLAALAPIQRAHLMISGDDELPLSVELADWLYQQWLSQDRTSLDGVSNQLGPINLQVLMKTRERPESRSTLVDTWPDLDEKQQNDLLQYLSHDIDPTDDRWSWIEASRRDWEMNRAASDLILLTECLAAEPTRLQRMAETLTLPHSLLCDRHGDEALFRLIEEKIRAASRILAADRSRYGDAYTHDLHRAIELLERWPGEVVNARIESLCLCPDLHWHLKHDLRHVIWERLWKRARPEALVTAQRAGDEGDDHWAGMAATRMERHPRPEYREFLIWAAQQESTQLRYTAVQALESMGEDSTEWRQRLAIMSRDEHPAVRLPATAALVRRGDGARLPEIVRDATTADDVRTRAEALRVLGELDAVEHLPLFRHALFAERDRFDGYYLPAAEESALTLARLASPEALTSLVQAALVGPHILRRFILWYLAGDWTSGPFSGPQPRLPMYIYGNWRQLHLRRWAEDPGPIE